MKKLLIPLFTILLLAACSGEKPQVVLFSPEAFAYTLEDGWEVNASVGARGFEQKEENDTFYASLSYTVDMITPADTILIADDGKLEETNEEEEFLDLMIESQFELNREFEEGEYKLIFIVTDDYSMTKDTAEAKFKLSWE